MNSEAQNQVYCKLQYFVTLHIFFNRQTRLMLCLQNGSVSTKFSISRDIARLSANVDTL